MYNYLILILFLTIAAGAAIGEIRGEDICNNKEGVLCLAIK